MDERENRDGIFNGEAGNAKVELKNVELASKAGNLYFLLESLEEYKNYEEEYERAYGKQVKAFMALISWRTKRRRNEYVGAKKDCISLMARHEHTDADKLEKEIKEYERLIDKKFWNIDDITAIEALLLLDRAKSIEEAVRVLERIKEENN